MKLFRSFDLNESFDAKYVVLSLQYLMLFAKTLLNFQLKLNLTEIIDNNILLKCIGLSGIVSILFFQLISISFLIS